MGLGRVLCHTTLLVNLGSLIFVLMVEGRIVLEGEVKGVLGCEAWDYGVKAIFGPLSTGS
jgi:hypothetical protein